SLSGVPLEALIAARPKGEPGYTVSYVPSGTMLVWLQRQRRTGREKTPPRLLALGDPDFARAARGEDPLARARGEAFAPLPGTRREVEALKGLFERADALLGHEASEVKLDQLAGSKDLRRYRYLHFATHGFANPERPMDSFLALADKALPDPLN